MKVPVAERIAVREAREDSPDPLGERGLRGCEACQSTIHNVPDRGQRSRSSGRIDPGMGLSREAARVKHESRLVANDREKITPLQTFHHQAPAPVDHNLLVDLRYGHARGTSGVERCGLERQARTGPRCTQQFSALGRPRHSAGKALSPALADELQGAGWAALRFIPS